MGFIGIIMGKYIGKSWNLMRLQLDYTGIIMGVRGKYRTIHELNGGF
jgi:hypothetical protein